MDILRQKNINFLQPFLPINNKKALIKRLQEELSSLNIPKKDLIEAVEKSYQELDKYKEDIRNYGENIIKEGIQMKQNRIFDQNSSQKARSWHYNMDTNRAEAQFADGSAIAIDCLAIEDEYGNTPAQRAELDWLLYNKPLECVQLVLSGEIEHYLSLGCDHGKLKD